MANQQEIQIAFANALEPDVYRKFMAAIFNHHLQEQVPAERQEAVVNRLVEEGYIKA